MTGKRPRSFRWPSPVPFAGPKLIHRVHWGQRDKRLITTKSATAASPNRTQQLFRSKVGAVIQPTSCFAQNSLRFGSLLAIRRET